MAEEPVEVNYKQLAKIRHLKEQAQELKKLRNALQLINQKSKQVLHSWSEANADLSRMNSTASSSFGATEQTSSIMISPGNLLLEELHSSITKMQQDVLRRKEQLKHKISHEDRSKKEDQLFYRRILYNYEEKITQIKKIVLNREEYIQKVEKDKRDKKDVTVARKLLLTTRPNFEVFQQCVLERKKMEQLARESLALKLDINRLVDQTSRLHNLALKFKLARETRMPYYRFKDIMRNGIDHMSQCDKDQYQFILNEAKTQKAVENIPQPTGYSQKQVTPEQVQLILRKEQMNGELLTRMIAEQNKLQEVFQQRNAKLKQAVNLKTQKQLISAIQAKIQDDGGASNPFAQWASLSEKGGAAHKIQQKKMPKVSIACTSQQYKLYIDNLNESVKERVGHIANLRGIGREEVSAGRSKSVRCLRRPWVEDGDAKRLNPIKESFYEKCNNFITQRFYDDDPEYEFS